MLDVPDPHERAGLVLDRVADRLADLLPRGLAGRALAQLLGELVGLLDQRQVLELTEVPPPTRPQPARGAAGPGWISLFRGRQVGGVDRQPVEQAAEVEQQLAGIAEPVGPRPVGLLERLGQPHLQPQLLQVERIPLLRQRRDRRGVPRDRRFVLGDRLLVCGDDLLARDEQTLEFVHIIRRSGERGSVVHDNGSMLALSARGNFICDCG